MAKTIVEQLEDKYSRAIYEDLKKKLDNHPGLVGVLSTGGGGSVWVFKPVDSPEQVAEPFFNIACASAAHPHPILISVRWKDAPELAKLCGIIAEIMPRSVEEAIEERQRS